MAQGVDRVEPGSLPGRVIAKNNANCGRYSHRNNYRSQRWTRRPAQERPDRHGNTAPQEHAGETTQLRWRDVSIEMIQNFVVLNVAIQKTRNFRSDEREDLRLLHDTASEQNALRGEDEDEVYDRLC